MQLMARSHIWTVRACALVLLAVAAVSPAAVAADGEAPYPRVDGLEHFFDRPAKPTTPERSLQFLIDVPYLMSTRTPTSGAGTQFEGSPGFRFGMLFPLEGDAAAMVPWELPLSYGFDVAVGGNVAGAGTAAIRSTTFLGVSEARGLLGLDLDWKLLGAMPYVFAGGASGLGIKTLTALETTRSYPELMWALRSGVGLLANVGPVSFRADYGAGIRSGRMEVMGSLALGAIF